MDCGKILLNELRLIHAVHAADESVPVNLSASFLLPFKPRKRICKSPTSGVFQVSSVAFPSGLLRQKSS